MPYSEWVIGEGPRGADFYEEPNGELLHLANWIECVRTRRQPNAPVEAGVRAAARPIWPTAPCAAARQHVGTVPPYDNKLRNGDRLMLLEIHHQEVDPGVAVITLAGKLMLGPESQQIEDLVTQLLSQGNTGIIFDITGLVRIDSTGIGRFISSYNKIEGAGARMGIAAATPHLRECFRATQLDRVFQFFADVPAARAAIGQAGK